MRMVSDADHILLMYLPLYHDSFIIIAVENQAESLAKNYTPSQVYNPYRSFINVSLYDIGNNMVHQTVSMGNLLSS